MSLDYTIYIAYLTYTFSAIRPCTFLTVVVYFLFLSFSLVYLPRIVPLLYKQFGYVNSNLLSEKSRNSCINAYFDIIFTSVTHIE